MPQDDHAALGPPPFTPFAHDEPAVIKHHRLPHWQQPGRTYFITFRLADSLPQSKLQQWRQQREQWLKDHPQPWSDADHAEYAQLFTKKIDAWLDAGYGVCWLRRPELAGLVESAMRHFEGERYWLGSFVIMPNHVHTLVTPVDVPSVGKMVRSWKTYSARQINERLQRSGQFWEDEPFDHIVRNETQLEHFRRYIVENPVKAGLAAGTFILGEAKACRKQRGAPGPPASGKADQAEQELRATTSLRSRSFALLSRAELPLRL